MRGNSSPIALFITPVLPLPGHSGRALRAWDWLQELSKTCRVHVLVGDALITPLPDNYPAEGVWQMPPTSRPLSRLWRALGLVCPPLCLLSRRCMTDWPQLDVAHALKALAPRLAGQTVSRIVVFRLYMHEAAVQTARSFPHVALEIDMDDLESRTRLSVSGSLFRLGRYREALDWAATSLQYRLVERFFPGPYSQAWLASDDDCRQCKTRLAPRIGSRPNRLPVLSAIQDPPAAPFRLLFVGTLNYPPNEEAVRMMLFKILPALRQRLHMPWKFCVVGHHASAQLTALLRDTPDVEFVPDAASVRPWYEVSSAVVVPLRAGGGTKFKSLEGFAHRRAIVSTPHGMRGLGATAEKHYLCAQTPAEFAQAITRLAMDCSLAQQIAQAGWVFYRQSCASE